MLELLLAKKLVMPLSVIELEGLLGKRILDFVFVARARTPGAKSCDIKRSLKGLFEKMFQ